MITGKSAFIINEIPEFNLKYAVKYPLESFSAHENDKTVVGSKHIANGCDRLGIIPGELSLIHTEELEAELEGAIIFPDNDTFWRFFHMIHIVEEVPHE